jgi:hypothetical protein
LRETFRTFPFADAPRIHDQSLGAEVVDLAQPPGLDESTFLVGLVTAICRPELWLAPGFLVRAPEISGAGSGKGLLMRAVCAIAFGIQPRAFTKGGDRQELDKRLASDLIEAAPMLFLDNVNGSILRSDILASILTERPARVRPLGRTGMVALNSTAFIAVTGNGVTYPRTWRAVSWSANSMRSAKTRSNGRSRPTSSLIRSNLGEPNSCQRR